MSMTMLRLQATKPPRRVESLRDTLRPLYEFSTSSQWSRRQHEPGIADFTSGNPQEILSGLASVLQTSTMPQVSRGLPYKTSESRAQQVAAASLHDLLGIAFEPADIALTNGAFGAISLALNTIAEPGEEVIYSLPAWPLYETMIAKAGLVPVKVDVNPFTFDLDLDAIAAAITPRTRIVIVNTPNNPTGKIYPPDTLAGLAGLLQTVSIRSGEPIYILSDEPYNRIVFDGRRPVSPAEFYERTLLACSDGYLAIPAEMPERARLRADFVATQIASGWTFPDALLRHALPDVEARSIDIAHLQHKRDWLVGELRSYGYQVHAPDGTYYVTPRVPMSSEADFINALADDDVYVMPGSVFGMPGYFRISLTASDDTIERSLPVFASARAYGQGYDLMCALVNDGW